MENSIVFDSHIHLGVSVWQDFLAEDLLAKMKKNKQDMAVIFGPIVNFEYNARYNYYCSNDYISETQQKYPDKFIGIATLNPWYQNNASLTKLNKKGSEIINPTINEIERSIFDLNLNGFKFHPVHHAYSINDPILMEPVFSKIQEVQKKSKKKLLNIIHGWGLDVFNSIEKIYFIAKKYPDLYFALAHCGYGFGGEATLECVQECANIYLDFTNTLDFYLLNQAIQTIGAERIFAGSDEPYTTFNTKMKFIDLMVKTKKDKNLILGESLKIFFNLR